MNKQTINPNKGITEFILTMHEFNLYAITIMVLIIYIISIPVLSIMYWIPIISYLVVGLYIIIGLFVIFNTLCFIANNIKLNNHKE